MSLLIRTSLQLVMIGLAVVQPAFGEDVPVKALQEALKKQGFYFGETTGRVDESTRAAIKRFQIRQGLTVTGEVDVATWQALQRAPAQAEGASAVPSAPEVSVRERAQNLRQTDREFLDKVEAIDLLDSVSPGQVAEPRFPSARPPSPPREQSPRVAPLAPVAEAPRVESDPPSPARERGAERPSQGRIESRIEDDAGTPAGISEGEAREFVESYLQAAEASSPEREVSFYADQVDYFDSGKVGRSFIQKDQNSYYRRWPQRDFKLISSPEVDRVSGNAASLRFRVRYSLSGNRETASGQVENYVRVRKSDSGLKIVAIRERKLR